jgi:protein-disulfide isomerase
MTIASIARAAALAVAAVLSIGAAAPKPSGGNWLTAVVAIDGGHRIGNPAAKVKLVEFISYTCPHCAAFAKEGEAPLQVGYIATGKLSLEVRHLIRDPVDLTAAMLTNCGPAAKFPQNHAAFMLGQDKWMAPLASITDAQKQRWTAPGAAGRRAIASDFGFYAIMERRGYARTDVDRCLADDAAARALAETSAADWKRPGISGTPGFAINGTVMPGTHTWSALEPQLKQFL